MSTPDAIAAQVWARLATVTDPELDESVTALGFVTSVEVDEAGVTKIAFRLPTYWCAANFAFLMADDMRAAASALPWVTRVEVELDEHMYAAEINSGVARGLSFRDSFGDAASDNLADVRRTFLVKAFQRRQEALLSALLARGVEAEALLKLRVGELGALARGDEQLKRLIERYIERRFVIGAHADDAMPAFVDSHEAPLDASTLGPYLRALRRVGVNAEFNGALCRGLLAARYDEPVRDDVQPLRFVPKSAYREMSAKQ